MQLSNAFFLCCFSSQVRLPDCDNYEGYHAEIVGLFRATPHRATGEPVIDLAHPLKWLDCFNKQRHTEGVNIQYVPLDKIEGAIALGPLWTNMVNDEALQGGREGDRQLLHIELVKTSRWYVMPIEK